MTKFKYKVRRIARREMPFGKIQSVKNDEGLVGYISGSPASDLEERFARAMDKDPRIDGYSFREAVISPRNMPGQLEVDFVVQMGPIVYAIQIDGEFAHKGAAKRLDDARKDALVNEYMKQYGAKPVIRIDGEKLSSQEEANKIVRTLL